MSTPDDEATRAALAVMTAFATSEGTDFTAQIAAEMIRDPDMGSDRLVTGFINLSGLLLTMIHGELGQSPAETLQWIATRPWNQRGE